MDLSGIGKVITISQAVFEGIDSDPDCSRTSKHGGCDCNRLEWIQIIKIICPSRLFSVNS